MKIHFLTVQQFLHLIEAGNSNRKKYIFAPEKEAHHQTYQDTIQCPSLLLRRKQFHKSTWMVSPAGKGGSFFIYFFSSNFPSWNNPIGALDTYQIYAVGHISGPRTSDDKEAYHIPHLLCPFRSTPFYGHLYYRVESC